MITVSNSSALHSAVVGEEGSIVFSLWGTVTRSYKGDLVTENLVIGDLECITKMLIFTLQLKVDAKLTTVNEITHNFV